jgi:DNA-directed RNA polymerase subunit E'/Rpb7
MRILTALLYYWTLQKELTHTISLHPSYFGPNMQAQLKDKLYADVEGTCTGRYGYVITVLQLHTIGKGKILPGSGLAEFKVNYQAIVFKPYKGEVLDAIVTTVNKVKKYNVCQMRGFSVLTGNSASIDGFLC